MQRGEFYGHRLIISNLYPFARPLCQLEMYLWEVYWKNDKNWIKEFHQLYDVLNGNK